MIPINMLDGLLCFLYGVMCTIFVLWIRKQVSIEHRKSDVLAAMQGEMRQVQRDLSWCRMESERLEKALHMKMIRDEVEARESRTNHGPAETYRSILDGYGTYRPSPRPKRSAAPREIGKSAGVKKRKD